MRDRRDRRETGRLLVDGSRETLRALEAGVTPVEAFVDIACTGPRTEETLAELRRCDTPIWTVASDAFEKLAFGKRADDVVLVAEARTQNLSDLSLPKTPLVVVIEGIEKPGNLGAILRTADGAGVDAVIVADTRVDLFNPNVIRASVGAVFRHGIAIATADETRAWLKKQKLQVFATRPEAPTCYSDANLAGATAIVLGSEAEGLSEGWNDGDVTALSLPMAGVADSLNVSAAAAILLYEARRQRRTVG